MVVSCWKIVETIFIVIGALVGAAAIWQVVTTALVAVGVIVGLVTIVTARYIDNRRRSELERNILRQVKVELEFIHDWTETLDKPHPHFYNPALQEFKCRDDAITYAITAGQWSLVNRPKLMRTLVLVSQYVRKINQQIDEVMAFRFSDPKALAEASALFLSNPNAFKDSFTIRQYAPSWVSYFEELKRRHEAIALEGLEKLRKPLADARDQIEDKIPQWNLFKNSEVPAVSGTSENVIVIDDW